MPKNTPKPPHPPTPRADWLWFVAARFPKQGYELAGWLAYIDEMGWHDKCKDVGHEFWCRFGEGSCARLGALTCNDDESWLTEEAMADAE